MPRKILHPNFSKKRVLRLECRLCEKTVCLRGMRAILLADANVELYSTDMPPYKSVDQVDEAYSTVKCYCRIKDIACLQCGNVVGYTVTLPCKSCLSSCNNGHLWMFHSDAIKAYDRVDKTGERILTWDKLMEQDEETSPPPSTNPDNSDLLCEEVCR